MMRIKTLAKENDYEEKILQSSAMISQAFQKEKITAHMYDFSRPENIQTWKRLNEFTAVKLLDTGEKVIVAEDGERVIGTVYLRYSADDGVLKKIRMYFPGIIKLIFPLFKALNFKRVLKAAKSFKTDELTADEYFTLDVIGVSEDYRGQGVGRMLLEEVEKFARQTEGCEGIYLYTGDENTRDIYSHLGYQLIDEKGDEDLTVYHMFKRV